MFVERRELTVDQRFAMMTDEQRLEEAGKLAERIHRRLVQAGLRTIEGEAAEIKGLSYSARSRVGTVR
jgi:hypothetical protein